MQDHVVQAIEKDGYLYAITYSGELQRVKLDYGQCWEHLSSMPLQELPPELQESQGV